MASILVVDDEHDTRYLARVTLETDGHRVRTAGGGGEALDAVRAELPEVILLDVRMPGLDGWSVLERLKSDPEAGVRDVPVLMLTALGSDDDRIRGGIEGAVGHLVKPVSADRMAAAVREALEGAPEPERRRKARTDALERLARLEAGRPEDTRPRLRLTHLEHRPDAAGRSQREPAPRHLDPTGALAGLTDKQRELLEALLEAPSVSAAASRLGVSRSNVYASLRRINRKLDIHSVPELLRRLRSGKLLGRA